MSVRTRAHGPARLPGRRGLTWVLPGATAACGAGPVVPAEEVVDSTPDIAALLTRLRPGPADVADVVTADTVVAADFTADTVVAADFTADTVVAAVRHDDGHTTDAAQARQVSGLPPLWVTMSPSAAITSTGTPRPPPSSSA
ncbi:hypothetical protein [Pseudonocardia abyssalis]|uniref:Uncharacterized protein n=1 Tax=Pseudonocardia abyssalis TaxID=2792008 RepID=A0ABS6ULH4_9PSEU|nr:hypothetical protein [Pseudonocardia abyssalis]MBW0116990.1 hypothetical protein [Pseudonocardia abyssalis]MBW0133074.1 hypothetical protein [Pseudonocardia abyssalis]